MVIAILLLQSPGECIAAEEREPVKVGVLLSLNIRPYVEADTGVREALAATHNQIETISLQNLKSTDLENLAKQIATQQFDLLLAIGPGAAKFAADHFQQAPPRIFYAMVLNPATVVNGVVTDCGISMNIPVPDQVATIRQTMPSIQSLGLLHDPRYNHSFAQKAREAGERQGIEVVPLSIQSKKEIPVILQQQLGATDALWLIPDRTVISESIVQYVIREMVFRKIPVVGYNRFFYDSGAAMAFVFNYTELGRQAAREALDIMNGGECGARSPWYQFWVNLRVVRKLGVVVPETLESPVQPGP